MNKSLLIIVSVIAVAIVGYVVYLSRATPMVAVPGSPTLPITSEAGDQPFVIPQTEAGKLDALKNLTSPASAPASVATENEKEKALNNAANPPKNDTVPSGNAEKIKLLESLKQ